jgi:hypothetical protein
VVFWLSYAGLNFLDINMSEESVNVAKNDAFVNPYQLLIGQTFCLGLFNDLHDKMTALA